MTDTIRLVIGSILFLCGAVSILISVYGVFKFRFIMNRMHCASIIDTLGLGFILAGLLVVSGSMDYIPKLLLVLAFQWVGSPIASHMVGRLEIQTEDHLSDHMKVDVNTDTSNAAGSSLDESTASAVNAGGSADHSI